jgi:hypothetical protein
MDVTRSSSVALPLSRAAAMVLGAALLGALPGAARADDAAAAGAPAAPSPTTPPPLLPVRERAAADAVMPGAAMVHSPALAAGGYLLVALGVVSVIGGTAATIAVSRSNCDACGFGYLPAGAVIIHGAGCLAGGIPMVVIGSRRIPVPTLLPLVVAPRATWASSGPAPTGLALGGRF